MKNTKNALKNQKGIGLIETLLAIAIGVIIITSMVSLAVFTVRASLQNNMSIEATQLAKQEIELIRAFRDSQNDWATFVGEVDGTSGPNCFTAVCSMSGSTSINTGAKVYNSGEATEISVQFRLSDQSSSSDKSLVRVSVEVNWQIGDEAKAAYNYTELSNWRAQ